MKLFARARDILRGRMGVLPAALISVSAFFVALIATGAFATYVQHTNTMEFCLSCHEMESTVYQEYKESPHFQTRAGVRPSCADCHVPTQNWMKMVWHKVGATKELIYHFTGEIDTQEKFEAKRLELAQIVWARMEANDSENCRNCHKTEAWNLDLQAPRARGQHEDAESNGDTCIDCHKGIAHKPIHKELESEDDDNFDPFALKDGEGDAETSANSG